MAINYTWDVSTVDTFPTHNSQTDVIHQVHWKLTATDDVNNDSDGNPQTAFVAEKQPLDTSDLSSFIAFASVTTSDVQGWVETALGADTVTELKTSLAAQIAEKVTPTSVQKTIG
tara:strand:- start:256 stop:600 length:345 start_codon:yes stop_codon:yes gene_type:complete